MRVVDFKCIKCGTTEERFVKKVDSQNCKLCGSKMAPLVSSPGMVKTNFADKPGFKKR